MKTIHAIYENGVFKPSEPVTLAAGTSVEVSLPEPAETLEEKSARFKARFPNSFGVLAADAADEMIRAVDEDRSRIDPDEEPPNAWR